MNAREIFKGAVELVVFIALIAAIYANVLLLGAAVGP